MPLYEYKCRRCHRTFEVLQKFSDEPLKVDEQCGGEVDRLISPSALKFKGSGWYVTDYGSGKSGASNGKSEASSEPGKSGTAKTEAKSETKSESKPASTNETKT